MQSNKNTSISVNFIMNFILTSSRFLFPLITFPYVSRVLLAEGNGKIAFAASVAGYFSMVAALGIPTYGVRCCAQLKDDKEELSKAVQELFVIHLVMTVIVLGSFIACIFLVPSFYEEGALFLIEAVGILLSLFGMEWLFQAMEQYSYITIRSLAFKILSITFMFLFVHEEADYVKYSAISVFASVGSNLLNVTQLHKYISFKRYRKLELRKHIKPIIVLFSQSMVISIYTNLDVVMLGFMRDSSEVGYYNAAVKLKGILASMVSSLGNVLLPRMSYYYKQQRMTEYKDLIVKALNFTVFISIPMSIYFSFYAADCLEFLAGKDFLPATVAMQFMVGAVVPIGITGVLGIQVLTSAGKEKYVLYSVIAGAITDFTLNCMLIPKFGASGAAFSTIIAECVVLVIQCIYTRQLLSELRRGLHLIRYLVAGGIALVGSMMIGLWDMKNYMVRLLLSGGIFVIIYGLAMIIGRDEFVLKLFRRIRERVQK